MRDCIEALFKRQEKSGKPNKSILIWVLNILETVYDVFEYPIERKEREEEGDEENEAK
jgi:hypothetical protein